MFTIYLLPLGSSMHQIGGLLYDYTLFSTPYLPPFIILALSSDLVAVIGLLCLILSVPLAVPSNLISPSEIPRFLVNFSERSIQLCRPLLRQTNPRYHRFGVPYSRKSDSNHIYAFLAFTCTILKAQGDVQHLWYARRASTRIISELMAAMYDKVLKRREFSGVVIKGEKGKGKDKTTTDDNGKRKHKREKEKASKADDRKAGTDVGKIVNAMAGDANRVRFSFIYGAPFEILIAGVFLYQLLGWSAVAGVIVILAGWPLKNPFAKRCIRIQKGVLAARDKRMGVLNELIGLYVKFIKFFAWEESWIRRALDASEAEMKWMIKGAASGMKWPIILSSLTTFPSQFLSIPSYFTSFGCVFWYPLSRSSCLLCKEASELLCPLYVYRTFRTPLNIIPTWIVQILQTGFVLKHIAVYLDEEVTDQVTSSQKDLKAEPHLAGGEDGKGFGLENATLKWNEVDDRVKSSDDDIETAASDSGSLLETDELRDTTVRFPEGQLSVVTEPTASGKKALLLALLGVQQGKIDMSKNASRYIKDKILFGYPFDEERYNAVVECCALKADLDILEDGDATVVLVTHHVELVLPVTNCLARILDGSIDTQGPIQDLRAQGNLKNIAPEAAVEVKKEGLREAVVVAGDPEVFDGGPKSPLDETKKPRKLVKDEHRETGGRQVEFSPDSSAPAKLHSHSPSSPPTNARRAKSLSSTNSYTPPSSAAVPHPLPPSFLPPPLGHSSPFALPVSSR
ncbi:hypothetical protein K443DRAFT_14955 [Laccaria amethystina LaAM-08-1]|uniref:ABC transmembrane type-1 domain-containing protein n=1 Tax=Laccaria amethystina LaAM-08-1 TaxID=1095629 RepID=A0A0C9WM15_9AGAR|nr:hypothetical protein K443DRAFT_14955 [Laccaria amethystina LaAM-08-1]